MVNTSGDPALDNAASRYETEMDRENGLAGNRRDLGRSS